MDRCVCVCVCWFAIQCVDNFIVVDGADWFVSSFCFLFFVLCSFDVGATEANDRKHALRLPSIKDDKHAVLEVQSGWMFKLGRINKSWYNFFSSCMQSMLCTLKNTNLNHICYNHLLYSFFIFSMPYKPPQEKKIFRCGTWANHILYKPNSVGIKRYYAIAFHQSIRH